jgi:hypothetical protein
MGVCGQSERVIVQPYENNMYTSITSSRFRESGYDDPILPVADSFPPSPYYLVRSNLPGLYLEIENPDTELPVLIFEFDDG